MLAQCAPSDEAGCLWSCLVGDGSLMSQCRSGPHPPSWGRAGEAHPKAVHAVHSRADSGNTERKRTSTAYARLDLMKGLP